MSEFEGMIAYDKFWTYVRRKARHMLDDESKHFIEAVAETAVGRKVILNVGEVAWRSQIASEENRNAPQSFFFEAHLPAPKDRIKPLMDRATEGRVNAKGIACLYLSTDRETSMTEVRPWPGALVSVARCVLRRANRMALMGHSSASMMDRYTHADTERMRDAVGAITERILPEELLPNDGIG